MACLVDFSVLSLWPGVEALWEIEWEIRRVMGNKIPIVKGISVPLDASVSEWVHRKLSIPTLRLWQPKL